MRFTNSWNSQRILKAYGRFARKETTISSPIPRGYEKVSPSRLDIGQEAWLTVVTTKGYEAAEHWLRWVYVLERSTPLPNEALPVYDLFRQNLNERLRLNPFVPDLWEELEDSRAEAASSCLITLGDASRLAGRSLQSVHNWIRGPKPKLQSQRLGRRDYVRVDELRILIKRMDKYEKFGPKQANGCTNQGRNAS